MNGPKKSSGNAAILDFFLKECALSMTQTWIFLKRQIVVDFILQSEIKSDISMDKIFKGKKSTTSVMSYTTENYVIRIRQSCTKTMGMAVSRFSKCLSICCNIILFSSTLVYTNAVSWLDYIPISEQPNFEIVLVVQADAGAFCITVVCHYFTLHIDALMSKLVKLLNNLNYEEQLI